MGPAAAIPTEPSRLLSGDPALCPTGVQPTSQPVPVPPSAGSRALPSSPRLLSCSTNPSPAPSPGKTAAANPGLQMPPAGSGAAVAESNPKTPQAPLCRTFKNPTVLPLQSRPAASPKTSQPHCVDTPYSPQSNHPKTPAQQCHKTVPGAWDPSEGQADPLLSQKPEPGQNAGPEPSCRWDPQVPKIF